MTNYTKLIKITLFYLLINVISNVNTVNSRAMSKDESIYDSQIYDYNSIQMIYDGKNNLNTLFKFLTTGYIPSKGHITRYYFVNNKLVIHIYDTHANLLYKYSYYGDSNNYDVDIYYDHLESCNDKLEIYFNKNLVCKYKLSDFY